MRNATLVLLLGFPVLLLPLLLAGGCASKAGRDNPRDQKADNYQVPTAVFTVGPATGGDTTTIYTFNAGTSSDPVDPLTALEVRWDVERDGHYETDFVKEKTFQYTFATAGDHPVRLEVRNTAGVVASTEQVVTVSDGRPTAEFRVTPEAGNRDAEFTFDASGSHDVKDASAQLLVHWDLDGDGQWDGPFVAEKTARHSYAVVGTYTVRLEVQDTDGLLGTATQQLRVIDGQPPVAVYTVQPQSGRVGQLFTFDASGVTDLDPADTPDKLEVQWDWQDDGTWDTEPSTTKIATHAFDAAGSYRVVLRVVDTVGLPGTVTHVVEVAETGSPVASFTVTPLSGYPRTEFAFDASGSSDAETVTAELQVRWAWSWSGEDGAAYDTELSATKTATHQYADPGTYTVRLEVKDADGKVGTASQAVEVAPAPLPQAVLQVTPERGTTDTTFDLDASGSGSADGQPLEYAWDYEGDGTVDVPFGSSDLLQHKFASPGSYTVHLTVRNPQGGVDEATAPVEVQNRPPQPTLALVGAALKDHTFTVQADGHDPDADDPLQYRFDFGGDGVYERDWAADPTATSPDAVATLDPQTVKVQVKDLAGEVGEATLQVQPSLTDLSTVEWTPMAGMVARRSEFALEWVDGKLWALGGHEREPGADRETNVGNEVYDPAVGHWVAAAPLHLEGGLLQVRAWALVGSKIIYAWEGWNAPLFYHDTATDEAGGFYSTLSGPTWCAAQIGGLVYFSCSALTTFDVAGDTATPLAVSTSVTSPDCVALDGKLHFFGDVGPNDAAHGQHEVYDPALNLFTAAGYQPPLPAVPWDTGWCPQPRFSNAVVIDGKVYAYERSSSALHRFDFSVNPPTQEAVPDSGLTVDYSNGCAWAPSLAAKDGKIYLCGGGQMSVNNCFVGE